MGEILDPIVPRDVRGVYKAVFSDLQRGKVLEDFVYLDDAYLMSLDGTGGIFLLTKCTVIRVARKNTGTGQ